MTYNVPSSAKEITSYRIQKWRSLRFLATRVRCTMNLYQLDKPLTILCTERFWKGWRKQTEENALLNGKSMEIAHCIMTILLPTHRLLCRHRLVEYNIPFLYQSPYLPDLALLDFLLFPDIKICLEGNRFDIVEDIKTNATTKLEKILK